MRHQEMRRRFVEKTLSVGIIQSQGPNAEQDFTDHVYWFKRARSNSNEADASASYLAIEPTKDLFVWSKLTNMAEHWSRGHLLQAGQPVQFSYETDRDTGKVRYVAFHAPSRPFIWVRVSSAQQQAPNVWTYTAIEQEGAFSDKTNGRTFQAIKNSMETYNDGLFVEGNGIDVSHLPAGFAIQPVRQSPVVPLYPHTIQQLNGVYQTFWIIQVPNAVDGVCQ